MTCKLKPNGAFLHVPKTGGTWLRAVLEKNNLDGHSIGAEHSSSHSESWAFCVLREPLEWWLSFWRYRMDSGFPEMDGVHPLYPVDYMRGEDPVAFLEDAVKTYPGFLSGMYQEFARSANYILQTENLSNHIQLLGSRVGWNTLDVNIPRQNESVKRDVDIPLSLVEALRESEADAMKLWQEAGKGWTTFEI